MNEIINWIAINNTLMIRFGFTAVMILVVIYIFRFIFIPKIKVVNQAEEPASYDTNDDLLKAAIAEGLALEANAVAGVPVNNSEVEKLQFEITMLKNKLRERETKSPMMEAGGGTEMSETERRTKRTNVAAEEAVVEAGDDGLSAKIRTLEARLSEYEIIAEDIAEISKLREENNKLKNEMQVLGAKRGTVKELSDDEVVETSVAQETNDELILDAVPEQSETENIGFDFIESSLQSSDENIYVEGSDIEADAPVTVSAPVDAEENDLISTTVSPLKVTQSELDALYESVADRIGALPGTAAKTSTTSEKKIAPKATVVKPEPRIEEPVRQTVNSGPVVLQSEIEVTDSEKNMIDDFEKIVNSKKG